MPPEKPHQKIFTELTQMIPLEKLRDSYYLLAQSHATNRLTHTVSQRISEPAQFDLFGDGRIEDENFRLFIRGYRELESGVKQSAAMLLDSLMIVATESGLDDTLVVLPLDRYMSMRGLSDEKEARAQINYDLNALERISFEYRAATKGKKRGPWLRVHIAGGTAGQIKNGDIIFRFNQDFYDSFKVGGEGNKYLYMYFPEEAMQGSIRANPWKYWLARRISEHKRMNMGKQNEDVIGVRTLIEGCPNYPSYNEVIENSRHISKLIITPFERDMDSLAPRITWEYQGLTETPTDYQTFMDANVIVHWKEYPKEAMARIEEGKKKRAQRQRAAKALIKDALSPAPRKKRVRPASNAIPLPGMEDQV